MVAKEVQKREFVSLQGDGGSSLDSDSDDQLGRKALLKKNKPSDVQKDEKYKQRVLAITSRGITHRLRHLMKDFVTLLPHAKMDSKLDSKSKLGDINEIAQVDHFYKSSSIIAIMQFTSNHESMKMIIYG